MTGIRQTASAHGTMLLVGTSAAAVQVVTALAGLLVARGMDPAGYGRVVYFLSVFGTAVLIAAMGLTTQITTEIAQLTGADRREAIAGSVLSLGLARLATLAIVALIGAAAWWRGDLEAGAALLTAGVALLGAFFVGALQGAGKSRLIAALQLGQAALYLLAIALWGGRTPERVYLTLAAANGVTMTIAAVCCRLFLPGWGAASAGLQRRWRSVLRFSSQAYAVSLLLAPYASIAVLVLGAARRFDTAASTGVAIALALILPTALGMVVTVQYYPGLCQLLSAGADPGSWIGSFYRTFVAGSVALFAVFALFPDAAITLLYTAKYAAAAPLLASMAPAIPLVTVGQLLVWSLVAFGRLRAALIGAGLQLALLLIAVALWLLFPTAPIWVLGVGHVVAAVGGLVMWARGMHASLPKQSWHLARTALAAAGSIGAAAIVRMLAAGTQADGLRLTIFAILAGLFAVAVAVPAMLAEFPKSKFQLAS